MKDTEYLIHTRLPTSLDKTNMREVAATIDEAMLKINALDEVICLYPRIDKLSSNMIDALAIQFHCEFYDTTLPLETRRQIVKNSIPWHIKKGTLSAVKEAVSTIFATNAAVEEWFEYDGKPYYFKITVSADNTAFKLDTIQAVRRLVNKMKNVRSWLEDIYFSLHARIEVSSRVFGYPYFVPLCNTKLCGTYPHVATVGKVQKTKIEVWIESKPVDYIPPLTGLLPGVMTKGQIRISEIELLSNLRQNVYDPDYSNEILTGKKPEIATKGLSAKTRIDVGADEEAAPYIPVITGLVPEVKSKGEKVTALKVEADSLVEKMGNSQSEQAANDHYTGLAPEPAAVGNRVTTSSVEADETATVSYTIGAIICGVKKSGQS